MPQAVIFGCEGPVLGRDELAFFRDVDPLGFILFARNCETPDQVRRLIEDLKESVGREDAPVLIDQEGGRVVRLKPPHWRKPPAAAAFGALSAQDLEAARRAAWLNSRLMAEELSSLGVTINCMPVLDLRMPGANAVVGDRSYGEDPKSVALLGRAVCEGLLAGGILPVIKHMPGHGRANADSHVSLPIVDATRDELAAADFAPFKALNDMPIGISAHVCYAAIDASAPATQSATVVRDIIRGAIGFDGLLLTDDLSMAALSGDRGVRAERALAAGCDLVVHCNGDPAEMAEVAAVAVPLSQAALTRLERARQSVGDVKNINNNALRDELDKLIELIVNSG